MKKRSLFVIVGVALLLAALWFGKQCQPSAPNIAAAPKTTTQALSTPTQKLTASPQIDSKAAAFHAIWAAENAQSQDYYGKVIDQYGQAVPGATAVGTLMKIQGFDIGENRRSYSTTSDQNGNFEFTNLRGWKLGVVVQKAGYEMGFGHGTYRGPVNNQNTTPEQRGIFIIWKLKGAEPMVHTSIQTGLACDGTTRKFDPLTGRKDAGDLVVKLTRNPVNIDRSMPFDWTLSLGVTGGGLVAINDLYPNEAPADGYQPSITINMPSRAKNWTPSIVQSYYIFDGKNYGRITINIMANYQPPPTHFEIDAYVNPSGSRNLEFDPTKVIKP